MGQVLFIVWRESVEAMLVIGILHAWLSHNAADSGGKRWLWGGVALGLVLAAALAYGLFALGSALIGLATYVGLKHFERRRLRSPR